jgi:hypothetical protein
MKTAPPKMPSTSSASFDHDPSDGELTCLLEGASAPVGLKIVEADGILRIRPGLIPATGIMLSMILGGVLLTGVMILLYRTNPAFFEIAFWAGLAFTWLFLIPFWWIVLLVINRWIADKDDLLRVDPQRRTLELCQPGRTLRAAEILAFTDVFRYYRRDRGGELCGKSQTGVLLRGQNSRAELLALVDGSTRPPLADRLAGIFQTPVRRIKLSKSESRALNDC